MIDFRKQLVQQLSIDYNCSVEDINSPYPILTEKRYHKDRRIFWGDDGILKLVCVNGKIVVSVQKELLGWCEKNLMDLSAAWFFDYHHLKLIDEEITRFGHKIEHCRHYYLPSKKILIPEMRYEVNWYEEKELFQFKGDQRFKNALSFLKESPDMLAVTAIENGEILGMAGASADSETMWQIGIDVTECGRGKGIGRYLTMLLKNEIIKRGVTPFYGTAESHIKSQRVAVTSGFIPAFAELYTKGVKKEETLE